MVSVGGGYRLVCHCSKRPVAVDNILEPPSLGVVVLVTPGFSKQAL